MTPWADYPAVLAMWLAMTGVMMAPVVFPWLRALGRVAGGDDLPGGARVSEAPGGKARIGAFLLGYLAAWTGFSAAAAGVHVGLAALSVPVPFRMDSPEVSAAALVLAGGYQFVPLKGACLSHCRSPAGFLLSNWRSGAAGRVRMGVEHGLHCVGCCWALMALALVVGMADLLWMAVLTAIMVAETALPFGARLTKPIGVALAGAGAVVLVASFQS